MRSIASTKGDRDHFCPHILTYMEQAKADRLDIFHFSQVSYSSNPPFCRDEHHSRCSSRYFPRVSTARSHSGQYISSGRSSFHSSYVTHRHARPYMDFPAYDVSEESFPTIGAFSRSSKKRTWAAVTSSTSASC